MNSLSSQPFLKMWCSMPQITGMSVPERKRTYSVACAAVRVKRGSNTKTLALLLLAGQNVLQRHRMRFRRVRAHEDHGLGVADVVVAVGLRAIAPGVGDARHRGRMADAGLMVDRVGAPERRELAEQIGRFVGELGRAEQIDRIRARFLADLQHLVADLVDRLIPGDLLPLAVDQLHRILQPALALDEFAHRRALGAMRAAVDRAVPGRLLTDPDAVLHFGDDRAAHRAMGADVLLAHDVGTLAATGPASALRTPPKVSEDSAARPPAVSPDLRRNARRSMPRTGMAANAPDRRCAGPDPVFRLISMLRSLSTGSRGNRS
jgi:hypothetical protein